MTEHDPLGEAGARLRGTVDADAFDPDWDAHARRRRRNRAGAVASVAAALAIVVGGVAVLSTGDDDGDSGQVVATAPDTVAAPTTGSEGEIPTTTAAPTTAAPTTTAATVPDGPEGCVPVSLPFRATAGMTRANPRSFLDPESPGWTWAESQGRYIEARWGASPFPQTEGEPVLVLGEESTIGVIHEGFSVEAPLAGAHAPCDHLVLLAYGVTLEELREFAEGLVPVDLDPDGTPAVVVSRDGLLGWWDGTAWQDVDARSPEVPVEEGTTFTVVGIGRDASDATSGAPRLGCEPLDTYTVPLDPALEEAWRVPGQIAVNATWDVVPRPVEELDPTSQTYRDAAAEIVADPPLSIADVSVQLDQVVRVDLDGDGVDEVIVVGRHPDADPSHAPRAGWYAFVAVRSVVNGTVRTDLLNHTVFHADDDSYPNMVTYELDAVADLNGDGRMEVVYGASAFEDASTYVVAWDGPTAGSPQHVLSSGCGV
jgi:hypothetical protein